MKEEQDPPCLFGITTTASVEQLAGWRNNQGQWNGFTQMEEANVQKKPVRKYKDK